MLKRFLRMAIAFALLVGLYHAYTRAFAFLASRVERVSAVPQLPPTIAETATAKEARELAIKAFGPDHWAVRAPMKYYDKERGYWIYWKDHTPLNDRKTWEFTPVAVIARGRKGAELKTIVGDRARVDFNRPFDSRNVGGEPAYITHALIRDNVRIRADKGTPTIADDLVIGPMTALDFDEAKAQITSLGDDRVVLREKGTTVSGVGLVMDLRRRTPLPPLPGQPAAQAGPSVGFEGVRTIHLLRDVEIDVEDVGRSGIVPGGNNPDAPKVTATATTDGKTTPVKVEPRPGHIQCAGEMTIEMPPPITQPRVGPPTPPLPTMAYFNRNVRLQQGSGADLDQLDCDHFEATLLPPDPAEQKKADAARAEERAKAKAKAAASASAAGQPVEKGQAAAGPDDAAEDDRPISNLNLKRAKATGHAVWLQSTAQHLRAYGNHLLYDRPGREQPDCIYFYGDKYTEVIKTDFHVEGKDRGKPRSVDTIRTKDITIYRYPDGTIAPSVVARGPGTLETRAAGREEVERFASWRDELRMVSAPGSDARQITLVGRPRVRSASQGDMSADREIIADLVPKPKVATPDAKVVSADGKPVDPKSSAAASKGSGDGMKIKHVKALGNVHLVTEAVEADPKAMPPRKAAPRRETVARQVFEADFRDAPAAYVPSPSTAKKDEAPAAAPAPVADPEPAPALAQKGEAQEAPKPQTPPKPPEPAMTAIADEVHTIVLQQAGSEKSQIQEAHLLGRAEVHQDPQQGKTQGSDLAGQVIDVYSNGENRARIRAKGAPNEPAVAVTESRRISGLDIRLDQAEDHAWVLGYGRLEMEQASTDFLDDTAPADPKDASKKAPEKAKKGPVVIEWGKDADDKTAMMHFYGRTLNRNGSEGPAQAEFYSHVRARSEDSSVACEKLTAVFDAPIPFVQMKRDPEEEKRRKASGEKEPGPQIASALFERDVTLISRKVDPLTGELKDKKIIKHPESVFYSKPSGEFFAPAPGRRYSPGEVWLYTTSNSNSNSDPVPNGRMATEPRPIKPASYRPADDRPATTKPRGRAAAAPKPAEMKLTHVRFQRRMEGRFSPPKDASADERSMVSFEGSVEAMTARVKDEDQALNPDRPPDDFYRIVSRILTIHVEPPPTNDPKLKDRYLLDAVGNARALTRNKSITGDRITYDSESELTYVYGYESDVVIASQSGMGQPTTYGRGSAMVYNHKTGQQELINPKTFQIVDPSSGQRSVKVEVDPNAPIDKRRVKAFTNPGPPVKPYDPNDPINRARQLKLPPRANMERRGFNGH